MNLPLGFNIITTNFEQTIYIVLKAKSMKRIFSIFIFLSIFNFGYCQNDFEDIESPNEIGLLMRFTYGVNQFSINTIRVVQLGIGT